MENTGTFSNKITYLGHLIGTGILYGAEFEVAQSSGDPHKFLAYTGNRVNIYIRDGIGLYTNSRDEPGLSIGIAVGWSFSEPVSGEPNEDCVLREVDWDGDDVQATLYDPRRVCFQETKNEYSVSAPGSGLQLGEIDYNVYTFPINSLPFGSDPAVDPQMRQGNIYRVIPVVARADFMRVWFWCDPNTWTGENNIIPTRADRVDVWALAGGDAGGSQRIGGGQG